MDEKEAKRIAKEAEKEAQRVAKEEKKSQELEKETQDQFDQKKAKGSSG